MTFGTNNTILFVGGGLVLTLVFLWTLFQTWSFKKRLNKIFQGKSGEDLEGVLASQVALSQELRGDLAAAMQKIEDLQNSFPHGFQKFGLVRFNPFKETGGDQSFAIALLDGKNNGVVVSAIHAREGARVYAKPIENGECTKYVLSEEEKEAIRRSIGIKTKT